MKNLPGVIAGLVFLAASGLCQTEATARADIMNVLDLQKGAWNRGDVEGFMTYYLKSNDITFQSDNSRIHGWADVLARYRKNYTPANMGKLDFTDLAVHVLAADSAYVLGRFKLDIGGGHREGVFTLILRKTAQGWRIVHDHTSSE
jgi:ketosteroid isomerase-like protein